MEHKENIIENDIKKNCTFKPEISKSFFRKSLRPDIKGYNEAISRFKKAKTQINNKIILRDKYFNKLRKYKL